MEMASRSKSEFWPGSFYESYLYWSSISDFVFAEITQAQSFLAIYRIMALNRNCTSNLFWNQDFSGSWPEQCASNNERLSFRNAFLYLSFPISLLVDQSFLDSLGNILFDSFRKRQ